jgi:hypothetical protein
LKPESISSTTGTSISLVHHKPWHRGGPPWTRGRYYERETWSYERPVAVAFCRTTLRTEFDPYAGVYVRRPIRVCRERYGY